MPKQDQSHLLVLKGGGLLLGYVNAEINRTCSRIGMW